MVTTGSSLLEPGVCVCVCVCECVSMHTCAHLCLGVGRGRAGGEEGKKTQRKGHQELCKVLEHGSRLARRVRTDLHQTAPCFPAAPVTHVLGSRNPRNACFLPCLPHYTSTWPWSHLAPWFNGRRPLGAPKASHLSISHPTPPGTLSGPVVARGAGLKGAAFPDHCLSQSQGGGGGQGGIRRGPAVPSGRFLPSADQPWVPGRHFGP